MESIIGLVSLLSIVLFIYFLFDNFDPVTFFFEIAIPRKVIVRIRWVLGIIALVSTVAYILMSLKNWKLRFVWKLWIGNWKFERCLKISRPGLSLLVTTRTRFVAVTMGLFRLDRLYFQNRQADLEDMVVNLVLTMINANFITKTKNTLAQAFAPSFSLALA